MRVDGIEGDVALVGVDDDLDRVADVADAAGGGLGVGKALAGGVGVLDPEQATAIDNKIGVVIQRQERRDLGDAGLDLAPELDAAVGADIVGDQDVDVELLPSVDEALEPAVEDDVAMALVAGVDILVAARIVELRHAGVHDPVARFLLPIVDRRLSHAERRRCHGRDVVDDEDRATVWRLVGRRRHDQAVAMGVLQPAG